MEAKSFRADAPVIIKGMECINKSYPGFITDFLGVGGKLEINNQ